MRANRWEWDLDALSEGDLPDATAALGWLARAFGFRGRTRITMPDGSIGHAEMEIGDGIIMLAEPDPYYQGPKRHAETCEVARRWSAVPYVLDGVHVYVDDVDAHFGRARQAGALILSEPEDSGSGRSYRAADLEGHRWMFTQRPPAAAPAAHEQPPRLPRGDCSSWLGCRRDASTLTRTEFRNVLLAGTASASKP